MSLLFQKQGENVKLLAQKVFNRHFEKDPRLSDEYDDRRKRLMYEDILYNLGYLDVAMRFEDSEIFEEYAAWLYQLLCNLMKNIGKDKIKEQMILHYKILSETLLETLSGDEAMKAKEYIQKAINVTISQAENFTELSRFEEGKHLDIKKEYLGNLLKNDTRAAIAVISNAAKNNIAIEDIYVDVLQEVMYEVGNLWHKNVITVDKEHYCTSTTQVVLSSFYPIIFSKPRNGNKILTCCIGSELHELGARMLSDLFEYNGWDSIYLGAAVPTSSIIHAIEEHSPAIVGLSVTMPQHLLDCYQTTLAIREKFGDKVKIIVGGRAFITSGKLWEKWNVDYFSSNAIDAVKWANSLVLQNSPC